MLMTTMTAFKLKGIKIKISTAFYAKSYIVKLIYSLRRPKHFYSTMTSGCCGLPVNQLLNDIDSKDYRNLPFMFSIFFPNISLSQVEAGKVSVAYLWGGESLTQIVSQCCTLFLTSYLYIYSHPLPPGGPIYCKTSRQCHIIILLNSSLLSLNRTHVFPSSQITNKEWNELY